MVGENGYVCGDLACDIVYVCLYMMHLNIHSSLCIDQKIIYAIIGVIVIIAIVGIAAVAIMGGGKQQEAATITMRRLSGSASTTQIDEDVTLRRLRDTSRRHPHNTSSDLQNRRSINRPGRCRFRRTASSRYA
jgi:hypothetical protein